MGPGGEEKRVTLQQGTSRKKVLEQRVTRRGPGNEENTGNMAVTQIEGGRRFTGIRLHEST